jgi:hypothetical protein
MFMSKVIHLKKTCEFTKNNLDAKIVTDGYLIVCNDKGCPRPPELVKSLDNIEFLTANDKDLYIQNVLKIGKKSNRSN